MVEVNGTTLYHNAIARIRQLEELNKVLAAEVDRMRPVVDAAQRVNDNWLHASSYPLANGELADVLAVYELSKPK